MEDSQWLDDDSMAFRRRFCTTGPLSAGGAGDGAPDATACCWSRDPISRLTGDLPPRDGAAYRRPSGGPVEAELTEQLNERAGSIRSWRAILCICAITAPLRSRRANGGCLTARASRRCRWMVRTIFVARLDRWNAGHKETCRSPPCWGASRGAVLARMLPSARRWASTCSSRSARRLGALGQVRNLFKHSSARCAYYMQLRRGAESCTRCGCRARGGVRQLSDAHYSKCASVRGAYEPRRELRGWRWTISRRPGAGCGGV